MFLGWSSELNQQPYYRSVRRERSGALRETWSRVLGDQYLVSRGKWRLLATNGDDQPKLDANSFSCVGMADT
jgi:hypothetical protein